MAKKFSQFPSASSIGLGDSVVGLKDGENSRFSFSTVFSYIQSLFVPTSRKINNKALTADITLDASDVGAVDTADVGVADGVASLDNTGKVPFTQLPTIPSDAADISYDNTGSGLAATNVQDAIDEVVTDLDGKQDTITASGILKGDGQGGVSAAVAGTDYQAPMTIDATPTENSTNPVQSGGVYTDVRTRVPVYGKGKNLLDNWYFMQSQVRGGQLPINRRGLTTLSTNTAYFIDRWATFDGAGTVSVDSSGLSLVGTTNWFRFGQQIPMWKIVGRQITLSVLIDSISSGATFNFLLGDSSGGLVNNYGVDGIGYISATTAGLYQVTGIPTQRISQGATANDLANCLFRITQGGTAVVKAVKIEYGSQQTLAHQENGVWVLNEIPDYNEELVKCETNNGTIDTFSNKSLATEQQLAYVETGTTASRAYALGDYFCLNGYLRKATTAISQGATITDNNSTQIAGGGMSVLAESRLFKQIGSWNNGSKTITIPRGYGARFYLFGSPASAYNALLIAASDGGGTVQYTAITQGAGISFSIGTGTLTATLQSGSNTVSILEMPFTYDRYSTVS